MNDGKPGSQAVGGNRFTDVVSSRLKIARPRQHQTRLFGIHG